LENIVPNIQSAKKRHRQSLERRARNRAAKSHIKTSIKKLREAVSAKNFDDAKSRFDSICKLLDQTASKKIIHINKAARTKSRLNAFIKKASVA
jgi:small subunit ribosomal protein S20